MTNKLLKLILFILIFLLCNLLYHIFIKDFFNKYLNMDKKTTITTIHSVYGDYLAGYYASKTTQTAIAAKFFQDSLQKSQSSDNNALKNTLLEYSYITNILEGNTQNAILLIKQFSNNTNSGYLANIILSFEDLHAGNFEKARQKLEQALSTNNLYKIDEMLLLILISWCHLGEGDYQKAIASLHRSPQPNDEMIILQEAMMADLEGLNDIAKQKYSQLTQLSLSYDIINLVANFYARANNFHKAKALYSALLAVNPNNPIFQNSLDNVSSVDAFHTRPINNAIDGIVFTFTLISSLLNKEVFYIKALICSELALYLNPNYKPAHLLIASILLDMDNYNAALKYYKLIPANSEFYYYAQLEIAKILHIIGDIKTSRYMLRALYQINPTYIEPLMLLANSYSSQGEYIKANNIYSNIIASIPNIQKKEWVLFYIRGTNYSLLKNNIKAEKDFLKALKLNPEQYTVMNDLAYTWLEHGKNIDKATEMIKIAYENDPQNPQVLDSMGWALYLQGHYEKALNLLENAIELLPNDPTVGEHLGDAYYKLSYNRQAKYEWERALQNSDNTQIKRRLRNKINKL
ncbi:tetratricopeptide repeat protein [Rickettsiales bacterium Ac37b]|nr:tetratricopeptide repeat protein [Rickettsiales bacterium Ac37b]